MTTGVLSANGAMLSHGGVWKYYSIEADYETV